MGFDDIDKKFNKSRPVLLRGPWYWDSDDPETSHDSVTDMLDMLGSDEVVEVWEGGVTRIFYAAMMQIVGGDGEYETREFATKAEAMEWIKTRSEELTAFDDQQ